MLILIQGSHADPDPV
jgi:hypothetical protein